MNKRVLVTGGAGFIGSRLVGKLSADGWLVWVIDNLLPQVHGPNADFPKLPGPVHWRLGDVTSGSTLRSVVKEAQPDLVFHLAAETGTGQSSQEVARYCATNVMGTAHLIEALREAGSGPRRVVLASTRAVYGEGAYLDLESRMQVPPARSTADMTAGRFAPVMPGAGELRPVATPETSPPKPASIYASTKLLQEHLLTQAAEASGWKLSILRFQNVYGPGQSLTNPYTGVLSVFITSLLGGRDVNVYEDGDIIRDFVFVDDVVRALVLAASVEPIDRLPINIGTGEGSSILTVARMLAAATQRNSDAVRVSGAFRAGDIRHAIADITRARTLLGWEPLIDISRGVNLLVEWAKRNL